MALERRLKLATAGDAAPEIDVAIKVAFATSDMKRVDQHFGAAEIFALYTVNSARICLAEVVQFSSTTMNGYEEDGRAPRQSGGGRTVSGSNARGHDESKLAVRIDALEGCVVVYCQAIGASAINQLRVQGVQAIKVAPGAEIKRLLVALQRDLRTGARTWVGRQRPIEARRFDEMEQEGWIE